MWKSRKEKLEKSRIDTQKKNELAILTSKVVCKFTQEFVDFCCNEASRIFTLKLHARLQLSPIKKNANKKSLKNRQLATSQQLNIDTANTQQFFLTEFEHETSFHSNMLLADSPITTASLISSNSFSPTKWRSDDADEAFLNSVSDVKYIHGSGNDALDTNPNGQSAAAKVTKIDGKRSRLSLLHEEKLREMERERQRRLQMIELV